MFVDGSQALTNGSSNLVTHTNILISDNALPLDGKVQELILWGSDQSANRTGIENGISGYYDIPLALLLDESYGSGAEAAYSVRKLRAAYTGAAMQVQATAGGSTAEIGFDVDNNLDTAALLAFAGTNEVRVSIWYDQSTNGNNAAQPTVAIRPIIVAAGGALVKENGRMALDFDGGDKFARKVAEVSIKAVAAGALVTAPVSV